MANNFLIAAKRAIDRHGKNYTYKRITQGTVDLNTGGVSNTSSDSVIKMYKKQIKATQFNMPNLIGKEVAMFYIAGDAIAFVPKVKDKIVDGSKIYTIDSFQSHEALGAVVLYRVVAVV